MKRALLSNRSLLKLSGGETVDFLQNLVSNDLGKLSPTKAVYAALLTPQGKFLHDFFVIDWNGDTYLDCLTARVDDLIRRLTMYKLRADVTIENVTGDFQIHALFDSTNETLPIVTGEVKTQGDYLLMADPRLSDLGARLIIPMNAAMPVESDDVSLATYISWRLALGVPEGGTDIVPEKNFLLETNFEELNGVSFSKGCYVGQELTARTKYRANIKKRLLSFTYDGPLTPGDAISLNGKEIATVSAFQAPHGLALTRIKDWLEIADQSVDLEPAGLQLHKPNYVFIPDGTDTA